MSLSQLLTDSVSGEFEGVEVGSADGPVDLVNDELDLFRDVLDLAGDVRVADLSNSSFEEIGDDFGSGRSLATSPAYGHVFLDSGRGDELEPNLLGEGVFLVSSLLSFSWYSFVFSFCHILLRFIINLGQKYTH